MYEVANVIDAAYCRLYRWQGNLKAAGKESIHGECAMHGLIDLANWLKVNEAWGHKIVESILKRARKYQSGIDGIGKASRLILCDECHFSKAINRQYDDWRNLCPHCDFSYMFNMCEVPYPESLIWTRRP